MLAHAGEQRALRTALWLNTALAVGLLAAGLYGDSSGLIANGLDNAADAAVYAISLFAVSRGVKWKIRAARLSGAMLLVLCAGVVVDVIRRFTFGAEPAGNVMIVMTLMAAAVNALSLRVLRNFRTHDVNLRAAWTFSINDFLSNLGVLVAGILVMRFERPWPDLVVGLAIGLVAAKGGVAILTDADRTSREGEAIPRS